MKIEIKKEEELAIFKLVDKLNLGKVVDNISRNFY